MEAAVTHVNKIVIDQRRSSCCLAHAKNNNAELASHIGSTANDWESVLRLGGHVISRCQLVSLTLAATALCFGAPAEAAIELFRVDKVEFNADWVDLEWSGGSPPYTLYRSGTVPIGGSESETAGTSTTLVPVLPTPNSGDIAFFRITDSTPGFPTASIATPGSGATVGASDVTVTGTVSGGTVAQVWINKTRAVVQGFDFTAFNVPLVLGENKLYAVALTPDGDVSVTTRQVTREPETEPPAITIDTPMDGGDSVVPTPLVRVSISDPSLFDMTTFTADLDGVDVTDRFSITPPTQPLENGTATWQVEAAEALVPGMHALQVTVMDLSGYTNLAASTFRVPAPLLVSLGTNSSGPFGYLSLHGQGFGSWQSGTTVHFTGGAVVSTFDYQDGTDILLVLPPGVTEGQVFVRANALDSNSLYFDIATPHAGSSAHSVVVDAFDLIYYVDGTYQTVWRIDQANGSVTPFFQGLFSDEVTGIAFDDSGTTLHVTTYGMPRWDGEFYTYSTGRIYTVDLAGNASLRREFLQDPEASGPYSDVGGVDVVGSVTLVGAVRPDFDQVILAVDLNAGTESIVSVFPLAGYNFGDLELDSQGNIYVDYQGSLYLNGAPVYTLANVGAIDIDCLDRVRFADQFSGNVLLLEGTNSATQIVDNLSGGIYGLDVDSTGNIFIGDPSGGVYKLTGPGEPHVHACERDITLNLVGDVDKVLADYDPVSQAETPNVQFAVLSACLGDSSNHRTSTDRVVWTFEDVDDPASTTLIDPGGPAGGDNLGGFDGSPPFTAEPGYAHEFVSGEHRTSYDASGCSRVRFHPSDAPGDNFRVTALAQTPLGSATRTSRIMTVWKRLHVEFDSMGEVIGPLDPAGDDALIGEIPEPDGSMLAAAFKSAYVEVVLTDSQFNSPDVMFDPHVPDSGMVSEPSILFQGYSQGEAGRESESLDGSWWVYLQRGYEGEIEADNDPDEETEELGSTYYDKWSLVFPETIRDYAREFSTQEEHYTQRMVVLHEIAHQFGLTHDLDSPPSVLSQPMPIMPGLPNEGEPTNVPVPRFKPSQLRFIRCRQVAGYQGAVDPPMNPTECLPPSICLDDPLCL